MEYYEQYDKEAYQRVREQTIQEYKEALDAAKKTGDYEGGGLWDGYHTTQVFDVYLGTKSVMVGRKCADCGKIEYSIGHAEGFGGEGYYYINEKDYGGRSYYKSNGSMAGHKLKYREKTDQTFVLDLRVYVSGNNMWDFNKIRGRNRSLY